MSTEFRPRASGSSQAPLPNPQPKLTSLDWRMLCRGIHTVPTIVSQMRPLFHTSTVSPKSRRLISLQRERSGQDGAGVRAGRLRKVSALSSGHMARWNLNPGLSES